MISPHRLSKSVSRMGKDKSSKKDRKDKKRKRDKEDEEDYRKAKAEKLVSVCELPATCMLNR